MAGTIKIDNFVISPSCIRYHPIIIKFYLNLAAKSWSAYKDLCYDNKTGTGVLVLPNPSLCDYQDYIRSTKGLNPGIVNESAKKVASFSEIEKYVTILFENSGKFSMR